MNTNITAVICLAGLLVGCGGAPQEDSEARQDREQTVRTVYHGPEFTFSFDDSYQEQFGQHGIDIVATAIQQSVTDPEAWTQELKPTFAYDLK